ncbi:MAG: hypothetical protein OEZ22_07605 [Spirochaetia bacterium]|nr:hypothetical protein [Spirochaetia bacterium]
MNKIFFLLIFISIVCSNPNLKTINSQENSIVHIAPNCIGMPVEKIILIRHKDRYCAIKFTIFKKSNESSYDKTTFYAEYESYQVFDKDKSISESNIKKKRNKLIQYPLRGIGRLAFQFGEIKINCGDFDFSWSWPGFVIFPEVEGNVKNEYVYEFAPTKWDDVFKVDLFDKRLKWYRYDSKRKDLRVSIYDIHK